MQYDVNEYEDEVRALAEHLDEPDLDVISESSYQPHLGMLLEAQGNEYLVLDESDADAAARDDYRRSLWAFNAEFLVEDMPNGVTVYAIQALQNALYEGASEVFAGMLGDNLDSVLDRAIEADGRGHVLSPWDGEEYRVVIEGVPYFIYRQG